MYGEVGNEPGVNSSMSQIPLCFEFLLFALQLLSHELCSLPFDLCNAKILCSEGVDIRYHSFVSQLEEGVVDDESIWSGGVEGSEISVPWLIAIEIGMGEGSSMKRGPIDHSVLGPSSL